MTPPNEGKQTTAFRAVRIFDGSHVLDDNCVIIQDGTIIAVGKDLTFPSDCNVIDGTGLTLLPGLIDSHTHTFDLSGLRQALIFGVTTELDMGSYWVLVQRIKEFQKMDVGQVLADLRSAGTMITVPGGHGTEYGVPLPTIVEAADAQAFVDARISEGADYIKIAYDNCDYRAGEPMPMLSKETMAALVDAAHQRGKRAVVHVVKLQDARDAIEVGADGLAHLFVDQLPDPAFGQFASHIFVIPTLSILEYVCGVPDSASLINDPALSPYLSTANKAQLQQSFADRFGSYSVAEEVLRQLHAAGVPILAGTDAPLGTIHGASLHRELELLVKAGLTPLEALAAATSVPAGVFGLADRGRIAVGLRADLLLVEGDPTSDIRATRNISALWKDGNTIDRQTQRRLIRLQMLEEMFQQRAASLQQTHGR